MSTSFFLEHSKQGAWCEGGADLKELQSHAWKSLDIHIWRSLLQMALQANILHVQSQRNLGLAIYIYNLDSADLLTQEATNSLNWHSIYTIVHGNSSCVAGESWSSVWNSNLLSSHVARYCIHVGSMGESGPSKYGWPSSSSEDPWDPRHPSLQLSTECWSEFCSASCHNLLVQEPGCLVPPACGGCYITIVGHTEFHKSFLQVSTLPESQFHPFFTTKTVFDDCLLSFQ